VTGVAGQDVTVVLTTLRQRLDLDRLTNIGFPSALDFDYTELAPFFGYVLNNIGDPYVDGVAGRHTKELERDVVEYFADLFHAPPDDRWGYVTTGGTEGNASGLHLARTLHPDAIVYHSNAAHYSVPKAIDRLGLTSVVIGSGRNGEIDYADLRVAAGEYSRRPAIVVANIGTTMTEAIDDVSKISSVLDELGVRDRHIHADAALAGVPLALLDRHRRPGFDLADGAHSVSVSGHKFIGSPFPCGVLITRGSLRERIGRPVDYISSIDATAGGSRSGHAPLFLWYALQRHGSDGLHARAQKSRDLAAYTVRRLASVGVAAWRNALAFTVVIETPPAAITNRWTLASSQGLSHVICMPGITREQIDNFVADLAAVRDLGLAAIPTPEPAAA